MKFSTALLIAVSLASFVSLGYADDAAPAETVTGAAEGAPEATKAPEAAVTGAAEGASKAASPAAESSAAPSGSSVPPSAAPSVETTTKASALLAPLTSILFVFGMAR